MCEKQPKFYLKFYLGTKYLFERETFLSHDLWVLNNIFSIIIKVWTEKIITKYHFTISLHIPVLRRPLELNIRNQLRGSSNNWRICILSLLSVWHCTGETLVIHGLLRPPYSCDVSRVINHIWCFLWSWPYCRSHINFREIYRLRGDEDTK